jgi:Holliday junction resolvase-like predicted endonuclease
MRAFAFLALGYLVGRWVRRPEEAREESSEESKESSKEKEGSKEGSKEANREQPVEQPEESVPPSEAPSQPEATRTEDVARFDDVARHENLDKVLSRITASRRATIRRDLSVEEEDRLLLDWGEARMAPKEIGLAYEEMVAYRFTKKGYAVKYVGFSEGVSDGGIDLIARKGNRVWIIQCKCLSSSKVVRENVVTQLYGALEAFKQKVGKDNNVYDGILYTSTKVDEKAAETAKRLGIAVREEVKFDNTFPRVKVTKDGIYHSPISSPYYYDVTKPDRWVRTTKEAIEAGFRPPSRLRKKEAEGVTPS